MRITGLSTGLDMDEIIKNSMKPYRIKIEKQTQNKEILEIRQKLYREVIKDSRDFYNKYFDITKSNSLLLTKNWASTKFESTNPDVLTVTAGSEAKPGKYTVTGKSAKAATYTLKEFDIKTKDGEKVTERKVIVNGKEFVIDESLTNREKVNYLNNELKKAGINVSVRYTDFASEISGENKSGFIFESTVLGIDNNFTIGGTFTDANGVFEKGVDAKAATNTLELSGDNGISDKKISINGTLVDLTGKTSEDEVIESLNKVFKDEKIDITASKKDGNVVLTYNTVGKDYNIYVKIDEKNIGLSENGIDAKEATNTLELSTIANKKISINGNLIDLTGKGILKDETDLTEEGEKDKEIKLKEVVDHINKVFKEQGTAITASIKEGKVVLTSNVPGSQYNIDVNVAGNDIKLSQGGEDARIIIDNGSGKFTHEGISNTVTLDGVTFKITGDILDEVITVNGKQNVTEVKDKLVNFINDYNTLIEKLNKLTTEKRNRNFSPLTADQKKEMSEDEIKLWNEKVEQGQLSRDSDVSRISNSLKQAMRTLVDGNGLNLEKIGIAPVADYQGTKNGTFTMDEEKLTKALEENFQEVVDMFTKSAPKDNSLSEGQKYSKTGILNRLKDTLYKETVTVTSALLKKAGIEGSSTAYNNELTKSIEKYEKKMSDMEKDFSRREQALYTKYAALETIMNKYNSQQNYLMQQLGLG